MFEDEERNMIKKYKIATSNVLVSLYPLHEAIELLKETGYYAIEIWTNLLEKQVSNGLTSMNKIKRAINKTGIKIVIHCPVNAPNKQRLNICSKNKKWRQLSLEQYFNAVEIGKELNAVAITFHPGQTDNENEEADDEYWKLQIDSFKKLYEKCKRHKIKVFIELMEDRAKEFVLLPVDVIKIINNVNEDIKVTYDVTHSFINRWNRPSKNISQLRGKIGHIHLSGHSKIKNHTPFSQSIIKPEYISESLRELTKYGYEGIISIEGSLLPDENIKENQKKLIKENIKYFKSNIHL